MIDKIKEYISEAQGFSSQDPAELEAFRIKFLGSKGLLKELFAEFKNVPNEQKKEFGQVIGLPKEIINMIGFTLFGINIDKIYSSSKFKSIYNLLEKIELKLNIKFKVNNNEKRVITTSNDLLNAN